MLRLAATLTVVLALTACSNATTPVTTGPTETTAGPAAFDCATIPGSQWRSIELLVGGESPGGGHTMDHWRIEFGEGDAQWWHTDVVGNVAYRCDGGELTAGERWRQINPRAVADGDRVLLRWYGDLYEQVDSFYDIP